MDRTVVYVRLLNEGIEVWRPVPAHDLGNRRYRLAATEDCDAGLEEWEFPPGAVVMGERYRDGTIRIVQRFDPT